MIDVFNYPKKILKDSVSFKKNISKIVKKHFDVEPISIIFVTLEEIERLNNQYRGVQAPTDVLSFNYNTSDLLGEVYICLEYIQKNRPEIKLEEEVYRLVIHGILHLYGYDHKSEFIDINQPNLENMFILQESMLSEILKTIK